jgi:stringent starvation protein B
MTKPPPLPPKRDVALELLEGPSLFVHLDPRREGVTVPERFRKQSQLVLQLGLNMAVRIADLEVTEEGITGTLSFNRTPQWCVVPWSAVFALVGEDGRGMVWPEDVPPELAAAGPRPKLQAVGPSKATKKKPRKRRAKPRPVEAEEVAEADAADEVVALSEQPSDSEAPKSHRDMVAGEGDDFGPRRKREVERPALAVVPAPDKSDERQNGDPKQPSSEGDQDDDPDDDKAAKRKLPPYLRIIK